MRPKILVVIVAWALVLGAIGAWSGGRIVGLIPMATYERQAMPPDVRDRAAWERDEAVRQGELELSQERQRQNAVMAIAVAFGLCGLGIGWAGTRRHPS